MKLSVCVDTDYKYPQRSSVMITAMDSSQPHRKQGSHILVQEIYTKKEKKKKFGASIEQTPVTSALQELQ